MLLDEESPFGLPTGRMQEIATSLLLARDYNEAGKLASWLQANYAKQDKPLDNGSLDFLARIRIGLRDTAGLIALLGQPQSNPPSIWLLNDVSIYLQREGTYAEGIKLLQDQRQNPNWEPLLDLRLAELEKCLMNPNFIPYFRRPEFDAVPATERILLDEALYRVYCTVSPTLTINNALGEFNWPKTLKSVATSDLKLRDATVLSDCSVIVENCLLYETVKAVEQSWRFTHARCNDFFGQYSVSDSWVQLTRAPNIVGSFDHAFLVPNPIEGIGHFIHDALPTFDSFHRYAASVERPRIALRRLRPFDRQPILDLISIYFGPVPIFELQPGEAVSVKNLFASTAPFSPSQGAVSPQSINSVRMHPRPTLSQNEVGESNKVYIARDDGQNIDERSRVDNAVVRSGLLERLGFRKVTLSNMNFRAQLAIWENATHIAGVHGAGLMNVAFGREDLKVTELIVPTAANYYTIAMFCAALHFDYRSIDALKCVSKADATLTADGSAELEALLTR